jgi:salicylate hydroxylase
MASTSPPGKPFNLGIVGGGISGLCLAITLLRHDIPITVYEAAAKFGEIGAGVGFGPNAGRAMELMSPDIFAAFTKFRTQNQQPEKFNTWFTARVGDARKADKDGYVRPGKKVGDALFDVPMKEGSQRGGIYRAAFLDELVNHIPDGVAQFGKKLVDLNDADDASGDMVLHFADGTTAQHSAVIGCDGIKSKTRLLLLGKDDPSAHAVFSGKYAYRGLIPMDKAIQLLGEDVALNSSMYFGYHGHLLTFPVQKGKTMNVVAFNSRETWDDDKWVVTTSKEDMEADFAGWGPDVKKIIHAMEKPDIWALFMHPPCKTYYKGRVCLLGDAAHATTPHQGAGAGMCVEDAYVLAGLIAEVDDAKDLERAFSAYDQVRRERTQKNVTTSKNAGMMYDFELHGDDLDKLEEDWLSRMGWIWDFDVAENLADAKKIFRGQSAKV